MTDRACARNEVRNAMYWTIAGILFVMWFVGMVSGASLGMWIHIFLVLALISLTLAVATRGRMAA